ncbi:Asp23/Gls24 family protein [Rhodococcus sp. 14-2470-1b]|nr:Asp23/Gls24 family protein [Rhodococcus sp. 15-1189-1-1a]OZF17337.1 Asp23/Gls24 family protein [Rhodococcus sp. 14-2686-1-2]OZF54877.1 Asp23/Gls24 family protein [Rhodococcus sp. 14-2470-1b]OZF54967.1 Asp23/Gls24 family protein [Rhodococcus sp. 14-2470-1b]
MAAAMTADERGHLEVRVRAVTRIAEITASRVDGVERVTGGLTSKTLPRVEATVRDGKVRATVEAATRWPTPIAEVAARVRTSVADDLRKSSGLEVDTVDVVMRYVAPEKVTSSGRRVE